MGSITGLYTVLVDGDDMNEPIADAVRAILDGHVVLTRSLAHAGHYPAIDVLQSVSRLIGEVVSSDVRAAGQRLRAALAAYHEKEDLIAIGAYQSGRDPLLDSTIALRPQIDAFLRQRVDEPSTVAEADQRLLGLVSALAVPDPVPSSGGNAAEQSGAAVPAVAGEVEPRQPGVVPVGSPAGGEAAIPSLGLGM